MEVLKGLIFDGKQDIQTKNNMLILQDKEIHIIKAALTEYAAKNKRKKNVQRVKDIELHMILIQDKDLRIVHTALTEYAEKNPRKKTVQKLLEEADVLFEIYNPSNPSHKSKEVNKEEAEWYETFKNESEFL